MDSEANVRFSRSFFDGDGVGLMPAYANTNIESLEHIRQLLAEIGIKTSPLIREIPHRTLNKDDTVLQRRAGGRFVRSYKEVSARERRSTDETPSSLHAYY
ncbi:hypothetical protein HRbin02_00497 [Candidatus Calditenuaceae archaeon HR02]|nr:hypothetical protein HRbin02_00497 [Candidatus Calditenuaceae archaeon HR02]